VQPNALATILRGTTTDAYGDTVDSFLPYETGIGIEIAEQKQNVFDPATQMPRIIRTVIAIVPSWLDVLDTDTLQVTYDPAAAGTALAGTNRFYEINDVSLQPSLGSPPDIVLTLKERSSAGITTD
jgi:hypothetical protein